MTSHRSTITKATVIEDEYVARHFFKKCPQALRVKCDILPKDLLLKKLKEFLDHEIYKREQHKLETETPPVGKEEQPLDERPGPSSDPDPGPDGGGSPEDNFHLKDALLPDLGLDESDNNDDDPNEDPRENVVNEEIQIDNEIDLDLLIGSQDEVDVPLDINENGTPVLSDRPNDEQYAKSSPEGFTDDEPDSPNGFLTPQSPHHNLTITSQTSSSTCDVLNQSVPKTFPCSVRLEMMDDYFLQAAQAGLIKWKDYHRDPKKYMAKFKANPPKNPPKQNKGKGRGRILTPKPKAPPKGKSNKKVTKVDEDEEEEIFELPTVDTGDTETETEPDSPVKGPKSRKSIGRKITSKSPNGPSSIKRVKFHSCTHCPYSTNVVKDLKAHLSLHGSTVQPINCQWCSVVSFSDGDFKRHLYEDHEGPTQLPRVVGLFCKTCSEHFTDEKEFDHHVITHVEANTDGFACTICNSFNVKYQVVAEHVKIHTHFKCTFCDKTYNKLNQVETHCNQAHRQFGRPFSCNLCDFRSAVFAVLVKHRDDNHAVLLDKNFEKCKFCKDLEFKFDSFDSLISHMSQHCDFHPYTCPFPGCVFKGYDQASATDHDFSCHITYMYERSLQKVAHGPDVRGLDDALTKEIKKKFCSNPKAVRSAPTSIETQSAVDALLNQVDESSYEAQPVPTYGVPFNPLVTAEFSNAGLPTSPPPPPKRKGKNIVPSPPVTASPGKGRGKRKSAIDANSKMKRKRIFTELDSSDEEITDQENEASPPQQFTATSQVIPMEQVPLEYFQPTQPSYEHVVVPNDNLQHPNQYPNNHQVGPDPTHINYAHSTIFDPTSQSYQSSYNSYIDISNNVTEGSSESPPLSTYSNVQQPSFEYSQVDGTLRVNGDLMMDEFMNPIQNLTFDEAQQFAQELAKQLIPNITEQPLHQQVTVHQQYMEPLDPACLPQ